MQILENYSLKNHNTFGVDEKAYFWAQATSVEDVHELLVWARKQQQRVVVLGEGSNVVLTREIDGLVIHPTFADMRVVYEDPFFYDVKVAAGMNWHACVERTLALGYWGLENLSLIPGQVGAAPIQNIGAYGVELCDVFRELEAVHIHSGEIHTFTNRACEFGYRDSIFKNKYQDQFLITSVTLRLLKEPQLMLDYAGIKTELAKLQIEATPLSVSQAVCNIRRSKLPDPKHIGNAGSFFKNPVITEKHCNALRDKHPDLPIYDTPNGKKIAAAWLIEKTGWKGRREGNVAVHEHQALVIVNKGGATGADIIALANRIQQSVFEEFGISLEQEPRVY